MYYIVQNKNNNIYIYDDKKMTFTSNNTGISRAVKSVQLFLNNTILDILFESNDKSIEEYHHGKYKILEKTKNKKNLEIFLKSVDKVNIIQYNTSIKKQDNTNTIKQSEVKTMNQFLKQAMTQVTNNPYAGLTKIKAVDLLANFKTITVISFDRTQDRNGNPSYRCKIAEDTNVYFYATSELKSMFTIALKETTVEALNQELPLQFDIEPSTVEYNGQIYPGVNYSLHQEPTIA